MSPRRLWTRQEAEQKGYADKRTVAAGLRQTANEIEEGPDDEMVKYYLQIWIRQIQREEVGT